MAERNALLAKLKSMLHHSIAESTSRSYAVGWNAFKSFANRYGLTIDLPLDQWSLCLFIAYQIDRVTYNTIKVYLNGIRHFHAQLGYELKFKDMVLFNQLQKAYKRLKSDATATKKLPVTTALLNKLCPLLDWSSHDDRLFYTICCVGTYGLLRANEFINDEKPLLWNSLIEISDSAFSLRFSSSKTASLRNGFTVQFFKNNSPSCPWFMLVKMLTKYYPFQLDPKSPIFRRTDGSLAKKAWVISKLQKLLETLGFPAHLYTGHSFRKGGATSLADAGVSDHLIKSMGRWHSWSYQLYIAPSLQSIREAAREMGRAGIIFGGFDPSTRMLMNHVSGLGYL